MDYNTHTQTYIKKNSHFPPSLFVIHPHPHTHEKNIIKKEIIKKKKVMLDVRTQIRILYNKLKNEGEGFSP